MSDLLGLNAVAAREALDKKAISAVELTTAYLGAAHVGGDHRAFHGTR